MCTIGLLCATITISAKSANPKRAIVQFFRFAPVALFCARLAAFCARFAGRIARIFLLQEDLWINCVLVIYSRIRLRNYCFMLTSTALLHPVSCHCVQPANHLEGGLQQEPWEKREPLTALSEPIMCYVFQTD